MAHPVHAAPVTLLSGEIRPVTRAPAVERWSWATYDFANTIWSMNIVSLYFATWLVEDLGSSNATYSWATAISSLLMAGSVPLLGAISDARRRRKPWVVWFTVMSCLATAAIGLIGTVGGFPKYGEGVAGGSLRPESFHVGGGTLAIIVVAFALASYGYQAAQPFYNAMLPELVPPEERGHLSGLGTAVGYMGTIVGLVLVAPFFDGKLPFLGALPAKLMAILHLIPTTASGGRVATFVPTALLFLLFSLPLILVCRDHNPAPHGTPVRWRQGFADLSRTVRDAREYPGTLRFIIASFVYQDAIGTIAGVLGLYAIEAVHFKQSEVNALYVLLTVPAVIGSYVCGRLVDRIGSKRTLIGVLMAWTLLLAAMMAFPGQAAFWVIGAAIGFIFGGVPTAERPLLLSLVPDREAGRFFSLLLLSSRAAAFIGPLVWGYTVDGLSPGLGKPFAYRAAVGTMVVFFAASIFLMRGIPDHRDRSIRGG